jgi:hypothetical protein
MEENVCVYSFFIEKVSNLGRNLESLKVIPSYGQVVFYLVDINSIIFNIFFIMCGHGNYIVLNEGESNQQIQLKFHA